MYVLEVSPTDGEKTYVYLDNKAEIEDELQIQALLGNRTVVVLKVVGLKFESQHEFGPAKPLTNLVRDYNPEAGDHITP